MAERSDILPAPGDPAAAHAGSRWFLFLMAAVAALFGALLYVNALHNPFIYDDYRLIVENPALRDPSNLRGLVLRDVTRPVVVLSYALDTAVWGSTPFGYHLTNVLLHVANVLLVFRLSLLAGEDRRRQQDQLAGTMASPSVAAFAAALLFAVHPMMTEAVGYITGRGELAYGYLFLLAFLAGRRWMISGGRRWWLACVGLWVTAVLAKETAAMLPFALIAYDWLVLDAPPATRRRRLLAMGLPLVALTIAAGVGRIAVLWFVEHRNQGLDWRFSLVAAEALWRYLGLFAFPDGQALFHAIDLPGRTPPLRMVAAAVAIVAVPLVSWSLRRVHSLMAFGGLWFVLLLLPSSILFALGVGEPLAEHRGYIAAAGLFLGWGSAFAMLWERTAGRPALRGLVATIAVLFVAQLSARTFFRNEMWSDPILLAQESVELAPDHWIPRMLLGESLRRVGRCDDAILVYRRVISLRPEEQDAYTKLGSCLVERHRFDEAKVVMHQLRALNPASRNASVTLGILAVLENHPARARGYFMEAIEHHPEHTDAHHLLAFVNGTLSAEERGQFCDELHAMADTFDHAGCVSRLAGPAEPAGQRSPPH